MATTKMHSINKTLKKAIDYIINPEKTLDGILIDSYGCSIGTADVEMMATEKKGLGLGNRKAYHLLQSFSPEDGITPEKALEIGKQFALEYTGGRYEFVIATHVDKGHIHNHIIFNATDYVSHRKYHYDTRERNRMRRISDRICRENNLSVIENPSGVRGKSKFEYAHWKKGTSWKEKLRILIDNAILEANSFEEFVDIMEMEGCKVSYKTKLNRDLKHITFCITEGGQNKPIRGNKIGDAYTREAIEDRILHKEQHVQKNKSVQPEAIQKKKSRDVVPNKRINLIVDISKNIKAQKSAGYEHVLIRSNLDNLVKTMSFLNEHKLTTVEDFEKYYDSIKKEYDFYRNDIKKLDNKMLGLSEKIKFTQNYKKYRKLYLASLYQSPGSEFFQKFESELVLYKASLIYFERNEISPDLLNLSDLFEEYRGLKELKADTKKSYKKYNDMMKELNVVKENIASVLGEDISSKSAEGKEKKNRENSER